MWIKCEKHEPHILLVYLYNCTYLSRTLVFISYAKILLKSTDTIASFAAIFPCCQVRSNRFIPFSCDFITIWHKVMSQYCGGGVKHFGMVHIEPYRSPRFMKCIYCARNINMNASRNIAWIYRRFFF